MLPVNVPRDPAPSRLRYRLQRLWLTPHVRWIVRRGLPGIVLVLIAFAVIGQDSVRDWAANTVAELRSQIAERPELMIETVTITGASDDLEAAVVEAMELDLPVSTLDLDVQAVQAQVRALDAVRFADVRVLAGGTLALHVEERVPAIVWRQGKTLALLDATGALVDRVEARMDRADLPLIVGSGAERAVPEALELLAQAGALKSRIRGLVRIGERRWDLVLDREQVIKLPEEGAVAALSRAMALNAADDILERDVVLWDMRDARRPILRLGDHARSELIRLRTPISGEKT